MIILQKHPAFVATVCFGNQEPQVISKLLLIRLSNVGKRLLEWKWIIESAIYSCC